MFSSITVWYAAATANDKGRLQRIIHSAEKVIGCNLPSLQDWGRSLPPWSRTLRDTSLRQEAAVHQDQNLTPQDQLLPGCSWSYQQGPGPPPDLDSYPAPTPQVCVTLTHITLHIAHPHCTPVLHSTFHFTFLYSLFIYLYRIYCVFWFLCVVLILFLCFMFTVCTYTPEQIPGRCKPTWQ